MTALLTGADEALVWHLRRHPRVSFAELARLAGLNERTVARRVEALFLNGHVGSAAVLRFDRLYGGLLAQLEITCLPSASHAVAKTLAARTDTRSVWVTSGPRPIATEVVAPNLGALRQVLDVEIARIPGVREVHTSLAVRPLITFNDWDPLNSTPSAGRRRAILGQQPPPPISIDETDLLIVKMLNADVRTPTKRLAANLGISESTVHRRLDRLLASELLLLRVDVPPASLGYPIEVRVSMSIQSSFLNTTLRQLAADAHIRALYVVAGQDNVLFYACFQSMDEVYDLVEGTFGTLPGVTSTNVTLILAALKRSGKEVDLVS